MNLNNYQQCNKCIMDTTDPTITFDEAGICNHCNQFDTVTKTNWFPNEEGKRKLESIIEQIKQEGIGKKYDCILGLSGGLDSSYLAVFLKSYGLRILFVHVDAGWNSDIAEENIKAVIDYCKSELHIIKMDWEEIKNLQLSLLKSGVANQDVVQDHAFFGALYRFAIKNGVKYVISGGNIATECVFPSTWHHSAMDAKNIKAIHKKYSNYKIKNFPYVSFFEYYVKFPFINGMRVVRPLNFIPYSKEIAKLKLSEIGFTTYERKHGESLFTKFFQNYYLPKKFNMDKRLPHLSSMINTDLITREEALIEMEKPLYDDEELKEDKKLFCIKLGITDKELEEFINNKNRLYNEFDNWDKQYNFVKNIRIFLHKMLGRKINISY